jgi:hypothetical protein
MTPLVEPGAAVAVGGCVGVEFGVTVTLMIIGVWNEEEVEVEDTILSANAWILIEWGCFLLLPSELEVTGVEVEVVLDSDIGLIESVGSVT